MISHETGNTINAATTGMQKPHRDEREVPEQ
jgi:hypothetical protein